MNAQSETQNREVHIFVKCGGTEKKVTIEGPSATGAAIKKAAGREPTDGLYLIDHGNPVEIADDQVVELKNGLHFTVIPCGQVS